jgi:hypothetical protein
MLTSSASVVIDQIATFPAASPRPSAAQAAAFAAAAAAAPAVPRQPPATLSFDATPGFDDVPSKVGPQPRARPTATERRIRPPSARSTAAIAEHGPMSQDLRGRVPVATPKAASRNARWVRPDLNRDDYTSTLLSPDRRAGSAKGRPSPTAAERRQQQRLGTARPVRSVGCFLGGSSDLSRFATAAEANMIPQTEARIDLPAGMQLLRVALCHLRTTGALPYVTDLQFHATHCDMTLDPTRLRNSGPRFGGIPLTTVRVCPSLAADRQPSDFASRVFSFPHPALPRLTDADVVLSWVVEDSVVTANPWEPSFLDSTCQFKFFMGAVPPGDECYVVQEPIDETSVVPLDDLLLVGGPAAVKAEAAVKALQDRFRSQHVCHGLLRAAGYRKVEWRLWSALLNAAVLVAVRRQWRIESFLPSPITD